MFQQLINPIKLEAVTNFYICIAEENILRILSFRIQSRNGILSVEKFVNQHRMRFLKFHYGTFQDFLPIACLMFL